MSPMTVTCSSRAVEIILPSMAAGRTAAEPRTWIRSRVCRRGVFEARSSRPTDEPRDGRCWPTRAGVPLFGWRRPSPLHQPGSSNASAPTVGPPHTVASTRSVGADGPDAIGTNGAADDAPPDQAPRPRASVVILWMSGRGRRHPSGGEGDGLVRGERPSIRAGSSHVSMSISPARGRAGPLATAPRRDVSSGRAETTPVAITQPPPTARRGVEQDRGLGRARPGRFSGDVGDCAAARLRCLGTREAGRRRRYRTWVAAGG